MNFRVTPFYVFVLTQLISAFAVCDTARWQKWEVERNDGYANPKVFETLPSREEREKYQSVSQLNTNWLPASKVKIISDPLREEELKNIFVRGEGMNRQVLFISHPLAQDFFSLPPATQGGPLTADPSASLRSFFWGDKMLKVSLPRKIQGLDRSIYSAQIERAVTVSRLLGQIPEAEQTKNHFGFLSEPMGIFINNESHPYGFLVRELPKEVTEGEKTLVPLLSFVARGKNGEESLLEQSIRRDKSEPRTWVREKLIRPLQESFLFAAEKYGIVLEAHQQNALLELDREGNFTGRIFYRDLDGARVDVRARQQNGLSNELIDRVSHPEMVFELERMNRLRTTSSGKDRPRGWNGIKEYAYLMYLRGSSVDILANALEKYYRVPAAGVLLDSDKLIYPEALSETFSGCPLAFRKLAAGIFTGTP